MQRGQSAGLEAAEAAAEADLRYVTDADPGIRRVRSRGSFRYVAPDGKPVRDARTLKRIRSLAVPPAWSDVWIAFGADSHIQATGRDAAGD
jgi:DNA topoisomerase I